MLTLHDVVCLILLPGLVALLLAGAGWGMGGRAAVTGGRSFTWPATFGLTLGPLAAGFLAFPFQFPPRDAFDWLRWVPLLALGIGTGVRYLPFLAGLALILGGSALGGAVCLLRLAAGPPDFSYGLTLGGLAAATGVLYAALAPLVRRQPAAGWLAVMLGLATATTVVESAGSGIQFGQYTIALGAAAGGLLVAVIFFRRLGIGRGGLAAFLIFWTGLLFYGYVWVDVSLSRTMILAAAPLAAWVGEIGIFRKTTALRVAVTLVCVASVAAIAAVPAARELVKMLSGQSDVEGS